LVTGCSGAGKTLALRFLEDLGYYCVDNLPAQLVPTLAELVTSGNKGRRRVAVCVDARSGEHIELLPAYLDEVAEMGVRPDCVFLDSADQVLVHRYSESRRRHPLAPEGNIEKGIRSERKLLDPIRGRADLVLDTSALSIAELRERIATTFAGEQPSQRLLVTVMSFGFKFGVPQEADLVLDVRFLPNPHYDPELRPWTGNEPDVRDYVLDNAIAREYLERVRGLLKFLLPHYAAEPKSYLTIAVGCTGGRHRSVAVAHDLALFIRTLKYNVRLRNRDISRPA
jgi:RNase adapter protein RapZ